MTDRDTLLAVNDILHRSFVTGGRTNAHQFAKAQSEIIELIDAHDNAMKEQTEADILGRLPASSRTCTCMTCRVVTGKLNQVFSRGETDE